MLTRTKKLFQLSLITVFATVLFLGTTGVNIALADHDNIPISAVIKIECHDGANKPIKTILKSLGSISLDPDTAPPNLLGKNGGTNTIFPNLDSTFIDIFDFDGVGVHGHFWNISPFGSAGVALTKNLKQGTFQTVVDSDSSTATVGNRVLSLSGKVVVDKDGNTQKVVGKINGYDSTANCTYVGKFKGKIPKPSDDDE